jgi:5-carboxymethyl-2-hydroxymuconate isomerase
MPHFILEYTANIKADARIPELLKKVNAVLMNQNGIFPTGAIRSRAIELSDYAIAESQADYAFVHGNLKIGAGRSEAVKKKVCDELFDAIKTHFADLYAKRYLALSLELNEFSESGTYKHNNIHARFKKAD